MQKISLLSLSVWPWYPCVVTTFFPLFETSDETSDTASVEKIKLKSTSESYFYHFTSNLHK